MNLRAVVLGMVSCTAIGGLTSMPARADSSASALLYPMTERLALACSSARMCNSADVTVVELIPTARARYCAVHVQQHASANLGALTPSSVAVWTASGFEYRNERTWGSEDAASFAGGEGFSVTGSRSSILPSRFPFNPFLGIACDLSIDSQSGTLVVHSHYTAPGSNQAVATITFDLTVRDGTLIGTTRGGGGVVVGISPTTEYIPVPLR